MFIAGDAAHVHSPLGGQGMNTGIADAMNLGWKLAADIRGSAPSWLLDSYERERLPVGAAVLRLTDAFNQLVLGRSRVQRTVQSLAIGTITRVPAGRRFMAGRLSQIGINYPRPSRDDHEMVGRRMPDVDCGGTRLYELLREGRFVMATNADVEIDRTDVMHAVHRDRELPAAVLVRPDGYVAWADDQPPTESHAAAAIAHWSLRPAQK